MLVLIIILIIIAIPFVGAAFLSKEYVIERDIIINRPNQEVYNYIKLLKNQDYYSKWVMMDLNAKKEYKGTDGTIGFISAWESENKNVGKREQEIINMADGQSIDIEVRFKKPFEGISYTRLDTEAVSSNQTLVKWSFRGIRNYMMKVFHFLFNLKKVLGKDIATSLATLKSVLEQVPANK